eukprot:sb/3467249/
MLNPLLLSDKETAEMRSMPVLLLTATALLLTATVTAWNPVVRGTYIPFDLESTPLQIKTDSTAGSKELIKVNTNSGAVFVKFTSPIQYGIDYCAGYTTLPVQPPDEVDKIWTIRKTATALSIECNGVEVLNYQFSDGSSSYCVAYWGGDVVEKIAFLNYYATASDSYRAKPTGNIGVIHINLGYEVSPVIILLLRRGNFITKYESTISQHHFYPSVCPGFTVDGSVQETWNDTDPGQTVTINCQKKHVLDDSSERTCNTDGVWDDEAPVCKKLIIYSTHRSPGRVDILDLCVGSYRAVAGQPV